MIEQGGAIEPLLDVEQQAYGVAAQEEAVGSRIRLRLRALPRRPITIAADRTGVRCRATATTEIDGHAAQLDNIYVRLKWPFGVDYILLSGRRVDDGQFVRERIQD
jgi:hypothetical protein